MHSNHNTNNVARALRTAFTVLTKLRDYIIQIKNIHTKQDLLSQRTTTGRETVKERQRPMAAVPTLGQLTESAVDSPWHSVMLDRSWFLLWIVNAYTNWRLFWTIFINRKNVCVLQHFFAWPYLQFKRILCFIYSKHLFESLWKVKRLNLNVLVCLMQTVVCSERFL